MNRALWQIVSCVGIVVTAALALTACGGGDSESSPLPTLPPKSDPAAYTQAFVQQAIDRYNADGLEEAVAFYNDSESVDGQWYIFIAEDDGPTIAHAVIPDLVGHPFVDIVGPDGSPVGIAIMDGATAEGAWIDYTYTNPDSGEVESKHSWAVIHDGLLFGSGWYE